MVVPPLVVRTMAIDALDSLFERLVLIDEVDPDAGKTREQLRERKAALVGAAHVVPYLVFERAALGYQAFRRDGGAANIRFEAAVQHAADRLQIGSRHQVVSPGQAV